MGESGTCKKCGAATKPMRNGGFFDYCWEHKPEPKTVGKVFVDNKLEPELSEEEQIGKYMDRFDKIMAVIKARHPTLSMEQGLSLAMHLHNNFYRG